MIVQFRVDSYSGLPIFISCGCPLQLFINPYVTVGGAFPMGGEYYLDYKVDRKKVRGIVSRDRFVSSLAELKSLHNYILANSIHSSFNCNSMWYKQSA